MRRLLVMLALLAGLMTATSTVAGAAPTPAAAPATAAAQPVVVVDDVTLTVGGMTVPMYVVHRSGARDPHSQAGILFLHWFAPGTVGADRSEYLTEAVRLAQEGTVSYLPQGHFPWLQDPTGPRTDAPAVRAQLAVFRTLLDRLAARPDVDPRRVAVVGHDYGAMYAGLLAHVDPLVRVAVMETPDATWENWFLEFWLGYPGAKAQRYAATFEGLEPVDVVHGLGVRLYLQFADSDFFIPASVRAAFAASAPHAKVSVYAADHQLDTAARDDRVAWLERKLHLG